MASQLLKLSMLTLTLMSLTYSSSLDQAITVDPEKKSSSDQYFQTLSVSPQGNKVAALMATSTNELNTSHASTVESKVTPEQQTSPSSVATQKVRTQFIADVMTIGVTINKDPPPAPFTVRSSTDLRNRSTGTPVTSQEDDDTNDPNMPTSFHPPGETVGTTTALAPKTPQNPSLSTKKPESQQNKDQQRIILIVVCIVILILILATILFIMVRSKRRRGSQSFNRSSRSSNKQDVWAGQVPELGDGKMTQHPMGNGTAGNKEEAGKEQEMVTFISGEKKDDSVVDLNEMGKGDTMEEKKPLLEEPEKETPALTVEKDQV